VYAEIVMGNVVPKNFMISPVISLLLFPIVHVFSFFFLGATIVVSGDGRYFSKDAVQVI
jgi:hypothetical protein